MFKIKLQCGLEPSTLKFSLNVKSV